MFSLNISKLATFSAARCSAIFNNLDMKNCINVLFNFFSVFFVVQEICEAKRRGETTEAESFVVMTNEQQQPPVALDHVCSTLLLSSCSHLMISINNKKQIIFIMFPI